MVAVKPGQARIDKPPPVRSVYSRYVRSDYSFKYNILSREANRRVGAVVILIYIFTKQNSYILTKLVYVCARIGEQKSVH